MKRILNICDFYLGLCVLCMLNGIIFTGGGFVIVGMQGLLILLSLGYAIYVIFHYKLPIYLHGLNVLLVLFAIYGFLLILGKEELVVHISGAEVSKTTYLKSIYLSLLPVYPFYYYSRKGLLSKNKTRVWSIVFFSISVVCFIWNRTVLLDLRSADEITNNLSYLFVGILPAAVLFDRRVVLQSLLLFGCMFFIITGMKRGAILSGAVGLVWFLTFSAKYASHKKRVYSFLLLLFLVISGYLLVSYMLNTSEYFNYRILQTEVGYSSGRDRLYQFFFDHFIHETNYWKFMFGNGANATLRIGENYAHNDWLEIAINQGVLGLIIYAAYWVCFFKTWKRIPKNTPSSVAIGMILVVFFVMTLFSMSYDGMSRCSTMVLGYYLAQQYC